MIGNEKESFISILHKELATQWGKRRQIELKSSLYTSSYSQIEMLIYIMLQY